MPLSMDEATKSHREYIHNIEDSISIIVDLMDGVEIFTFNLKDVTKGLKGIIVETEMISISSQKKIFDEYEKMVANEGKRRKIISTMKNFENVKEIRERVKRKRRAERISITPVIRTISITKGEEKKMKID